MANKLYRERREFIQWLATPDIDRDENTQKALAERLGVSEQTLCKWRHEKGIVTEVNRLVDEHFADEYSEITNALKREARRGSFPHQKLYFEMIGKYIQKIAPTSPDGEREWLAGLPDGIIDTEIVSIVDQARARTTGSPGAGAPLPVDDASTP